MGMDEIWDRGVWGWAWSCGHDGNDQLKNISQNSTLKSFLFMNSAVCHSGKNKTLYLGQTVYKLSSMSLLDVGCHQKSVSLQSLCNALLGYDLFFQDFWAS